MSRGGVCYGGMGAPLICFDDETARQLHQKYEGGAADAATEIEYRMRRRIAEKGYVTEEDVKQIVQQVVGPTSVTVNRQSTAGTWGGAAYVTPGVSVTTDLVSEPPPEPEPIKPQPLPSGKPLNSDTGGVYFNYYGSLVRWGEIPKGDLYALYTGSGTIYVYNATTGEFYTYTPGSKSFGRIGITGGLVPIDTHRCSNVGADLRKCYISVSDFMKMAQKVTPEQLKAAVEGLTQPVKYQVPPQPSNVYTYEVSVPPNAVEAPQGTKVYETKEGGSLVVYVDNLKQASPEVQESVARYVSQRIKPQPEQPSLDWRGVLLLLGIIYLATQGKGYG